MTKSNVTSMPRLHVLAHAELHPQFRASTVATIGLLDD